MLQATINDLQHVGKALESSVEQRGDHIALKFQEKNITFNEFNEQVNQLVNGLRDMGTSVGDHIVIMLPNCVEHVVSLFAAAKCGAIQIPLNIERNAENLISMIHRSSPNVIITETKFLQVIEEAYKGSHSDELPHIVTIDALQDQDYSDTSLKDISYIYSEILGGTNAKMAEVSPSDPLQYIFTSGTTGDPKIVSISHGYALHMASEICWHLEISTEDVLYTPYPLFHAQAPMLTIMPSVLLGATVALGVRFSASRFWDEIEYYQATIFDYMD